MTLGVMPCTRMLSGPILSKFGRVVYYDTRFIICKFGTNSLKTKKVFHTKSLLLTVRTDRFYGSYMM